MQKHQENESKIELADVAKNVAGILSTGESVSVEGLGSLLHGCGLEGKVNCYPGTPTDECHRVAFFISLQSQQHARDNGHLSFQKMLAHLVRHMQGACEDQTLFAVIITDSWDVRAWEEWSAEIAKIKASKSLEVFLIVGDKTL